MKSFSLKMVKETKMKSLQRNVENASFSKANLIDKIFRFVALDYAIIEKDKNVH